MSRIHIWFCLALKFQIFPMCYTASHESFVGKLGSVAKEKNVVSNNLCHGKLSLVGLCSSVTDDIGKEEYLFKFLIHFLWMFVVLQH